MAINSGHIVPQGICTSPLNSKPPTWSYLKKKKIGNATDLYLTYYSTCNWNVKSETWAFEMSWWMKEINSPDLKKNRIREKNTLNVTEQIAARLLAWNNYNLKPNEKKNMQQ